MECPEGVDQIAERILFRRRRQRENGAFHAGRHRPVQHEARKKHQRQLEGTKTSPHKKKNTPHASQRWIASLKLASCSIFRFSIIQYRRLPLFTGTFSRLFRPPRQRIWRRCSLWSWNSSASRRAADRTPTNRPPRRLRVRRRRRSEIVAKNDQLPFVQSIDQVLNTVEKRKKRFGSKIPSHFSFL